MSFAHNLQAIGGTIELENYEGHGLKMTLRLPLTLSIIAGLSVRAGDQIFGISRSSVVELVSASNANVKIEHVGGSKVASIRGERYPFAKLETILGIENAESTESESTDADSDAACHWRDLCAGCCQRHRQ